MIIITAPSKTQSPEQTPPPEYSKATIPQLLEKSTHLIAELRKLNAKQLAALMKTSSKLTESTYHRIHSFATPFDKNNSTPALLLFQGDAYNFIAAREYNKNQLLHAQQHLLILSGLYGLLRPLDLTQPYRLEMQTKLKTGEAENLYQFWRDAVNEKLQRAISHHPSPLIINLASAEYSKVVDRRKLAAVGCKIIDIIFQQPNPKAQGKYKTIPIHSKRARGMMIHEMITKEITEGEELKAFAMDGYSFQPEDSTATTWLFQKK